jgi:hypothetical protein
MTSLEDLTRRQYVAEIERLNQKIESLCTVLEIIESQCGLNLDHSDLTLVLVSNMARQALKEDGCYDHLGAAS